MKELFNHSRMSVSRMFGIISGLLSLILMILVSVPAMGQLAPDKSKMQEQMNEMTHPVFIKNDGQVKDLDGNLLPNVLYLMNSSGMKVQLRPNGFSYDTWVHVWESSEVSSATKRRRPAREKDSADQAQIKETRYHRVDVNFQGANPNPVLEALEPVEESISYINGTMEMEIRQYRRIVYREVYPGIDVEFVASGNAQLPVEYNFIVKPGANPSLIALDYQGANAVELKNGKINLTLAHGTLEENIPASWLDNHSENVAVSYVSKGGTAIGFQVAGYDNTRQLTIDPTPRLVFGTFYQRPGAFVSDGNENNEFTYGDVDVDSNGNTYLSGKGRVNLFTTTAGAFQTTKASPTNGSDFIIAKFDNKGQRLAATYYGGTGSEFFIKIACAADAFYVAFITESANLGTLNNFVGASDILVAKMNPNLKQRYWARYVGGTDYEREIEITADKDGNAVLVGETQSPDYPYAGGLPSDNTNDVKLVITKLSSSGSLIFSGVIGKAQGVPDGNVVHLPLNLKTDATGAIFLAGNATLYDVPNSNAFNNYVTSGAYQTQVPVKPGFDNGYIDSYFLMKFNANGVKQWGTWIGGVYYEYDDIRLSLDKSGFPWVAFITTSTFPLTADAYQPELPGTLLADAATLDEGDFYKTYLQKYSRDGDSLLYSSTYEPNSFLFPFTCAFDIDTSTNDIYLEIGYFNSPEGTSEDLVSNCAYQGSYIVDEAPSFNGATTVAKYSNAGKTREWSSLLPVGVGGELAFRAEKLFVADFIRSNRNPQYLQDVTTPGVYQETPFRKNGFLLRCMDEGVLPNGVTVSSSSISPATQTACSGGLTQPILGNKVDLTGPPDYTNGILYQWQIASTSTGPWQNITGETGRNLTPEPQTAGPWYFRRLTQLAGPACDKITLDSSNVAELLISTNIAPRAKASGPKFYTCLGNPITLDGSASGGTPPYTYEWYIGGNTLPNSTETNLTDTPEETTLYTFKIIDAIGCFSIDQVSVEPVIADAGPDLPFCEGTAGVRLGGVPVQGAMEVNYGWSPATNLSCTACPNPVATPTVPTTYTLTVTVLEKSGMTCTMTDEVDVNVVSQPAANFAGPDVTVCQGETATIGLPAASGFSYTWASGQYIVDNRQAQTTYDAGTNVVAVPLIYSSTAEKDGCVFVDFMKVYTEYFQITPRNLNLCEGPFWFKQEAEAGEVNSPDAVYTWEKVSGDAQIEVLATRNNGADAYIRLKPGTGNSVTFRRKIELNGHVCYSFQNTLAVCAGGGGGGCYAEVRVLGGSGCPLPGGGYKVYAKNVDPNDYKFKWSPSWAFNNDTLAVPTLITANNGVNISVIATNRWASNIQCVDTLYVNDPALTLPIFSVSDTFMCPNQSIGIGRPFVQGYSYLWYNTKGMANPDFDKYISDPIITLANNESYVIRVEDIGTGCFVFDTMQVVVSPVKVDAGPDLQVCSGAVVTIGAEPEAGTNFTYSWNPSNVPWQNNTNATSPMPSLLFGGSNLTMVVTATDPLTNCSILDTVLLTAPAGGPLPSLATPAPICPGSSAMIGVTPVEGAVYSWSPTTDLSCATCAMTTASPTSTTTYTLSVSGCGPTVTASVTVTVLPAPDFTLTNKEICPSSPMGIGIGASGNTGSLSNVQSYSWSPAEGLSCTDCANPNAGPSSPTTYSLEVTYTNGCKTTKTCTITPPAGLTANAGVNKSICPGEEVTIGSDPASGVTYSWSPSTGLSSSTVSNPTASPSSTTNYTVTLTKGGCTATDQVLVTVKALPEINITGNTTICRGGETTIGTSSVPNIAYQWAPTTGVEDPNKATSIVRPVANTKYKLIQTNLNTGCTSFKEVQVIVNEPNFSIDASAPAPLEVCQGTAITLPLELTPSNTNCVFFWAPTPGLNNAFVQNPVATPMTNTTYRLEVTNLDNNCILTAYVPVTVVPLELCTGNEFGDVPVALEKSSAGYHKRTTKLKIGLNTDSELGPQSVYPGSISDGDDTNGDDEDGLGTLPNLHPSTTSFETVVSSVMNTEYASAYMAGWIDFNRDNCFDDNERTPVQYIPKDTLGAPPVELVWSGFNPSGELPFGKIYMRLRLTADDRDGWAQQPSANGYRRSGEVEDYCMRVYQSNAYPDSKVANTGDNAVGDLSTNDDMPPGTKYLSPTVMGTNPSAAMPVVDMNGTFTFSATVPGVYNYLVPVFDGVVTEQIKLTITVLNPAVVSNPVLGTDNAITVVNTPVMLNTLANDFAGGLLSQLNPSSVTITVAPLHGVAVVDTATGKIMYTPNAGYVGSDTYTYSVGDDSSPVRTATGCQFIQVIPENCENTVFASNDQVCAIAGFKNRGNVLDNDMDAEGDQIYAVPMTVTTADYTFMLNADGSYMLQISNDYTDPIVINYAINDDQFYPQGRDTAMLCFYLKSAIGNLVWDDKDRDGVQDSLEMGVANATVTMHTCSNGTPGAALPDYTVTTDEFGVYAFPVPAVGSYALRFDYSSILNGSKYKFSIPNIEFNGIDTLDSDANMTTGFTGCFEVVNSSSVTHLDAGIFLDADGDYQPDCFDSDTLIIDPLGYFYCENTGEILNGGSISVTGPGNIYMIFDGTSGFYQFLVDASGLYTIAVTNPGGYVSSEDCVVEDDTLDAGGITLVVGSDDADGDDFLDDYTCPANTFYYHMLLSPGDYIVNNNFPMSCLDLGDLPTGYPTLVANDGPSHAILQHPLVFLGDTVDVEGNGQPDIMAGMMSGGDDAPTATSPDDEDGIAVLPALVITQDAPVIVKVNNLSAKDAKLVGFLDLNADFDFDDAGEMQSSNVQAGYSGNDTLTFSVPVDAAVGSKVGLRLRLSTECENSVPPPPPGPVPVTSFDGSIDLTDPKFSRPFSPGNNSLACNENAPPGNNYYDLYEFTVSANGTYVFDASGAPGDTYAILSETPFDPLQPCAKFIKTGNNESDQDPVITANLVAGVNYVLLFTPNAANNAIGSYSIALSGDGDVLVEDNNQPQACSYNFLLEDEYGDGWNNASMKIYKGSVLVATLGGTFNGGYSQEVNVPLDPNTSYSLFYMGGGDYPDEVGITVYDESGNEVLFLDYGAGTVGDTLFTWNTGVCIPSTPPIMTPTGTICNGEIEDYMLVIAGFDYGDLPDSYNTTGSDNPPAHIVSEDLKLGSSVDSELDGTPDPMAGLMGGGDDGDPGLVTFGTSTPAGDDENGVMLATPMVPGSDAAFMVDAMNMTGSDAVLQAWIDFDGSGTFEPGEELTTGDFAPDGANVPVGGLSGAKLYFEVPDDATFYEGNAMVRFRLSQNGGLDPDNQAGTPPFGEIEDYKFPLAKIGNIVFEDRDFDGIQDGGEPGIDDVNVMVTWAGPNGIIGDSDDVMYQTTTGPDSGQETGEYYFCGLINGTYKLKFTTPDDMTPTRSNQGGQADGSTVDSDGSLTGMDLTMAMETFVLGCAPCQPLNENGLGDEAPANVGTFPDAQTDETHDQGFAFLDYGDLPESGNGDAFNTSMAEGGAVHVITPGLKLGSSVDGERDGNGNAAANGDDNNNTGSADDEDGISFPTPMVPGFDAAVEVTAMNMTGTNAVLQGWIDWDGDGELDGSEELSFDNGGIIPAGGVTDALYSFPVPAGATFNEGMAFMRFRLSRTGGQDADGPDKFNPSTAVPQGEVEDYKINLAKVGSQAWYDVNNDGVQDAGEPGINDVDIQMVFFGPDGVAGGGDDRTYDQTTAVMGGSEGMYMFSGLVAGMYKLSVLATPDGLSDALSDVGVSDDLDSDDPSGVMVVINDPADLVTDEDGLFDDPDALDFPDAQNDLRYDFGFIALDYGDLPDTYGTLEVSDGPFAVLNEHLYLGTFIDSEGDGKPEAMAGAMTGGDDNSSTSLITYGVAANDDDEDGLVQVVTPMVPGRRACWRVTVHNTTGEPAVLQAWVDWNGDGVYDADEELNSGGFVSGGMPIPNGGVVNEEVCFNVPADATFTGGQAMVRFRLSEDGGLSATGEPVAPGFGEVEDYKISLAKVGNLVWYDTNNNGVQDEPGVDGINNIPVKLLWAGNDLEFGNADDILYTTSTSTMGVEGMYMFTGLIPGSYKLSLGDLPTGYLPTQLNVGSDVTDSDTPTGVMVMIPTPPTSLITGENGTGDVPNDPHFPDNQNDLTYDFGLIATDLGDAPDTYGTTDGSVRDGAIHVLSDRLKLGALVDGELDGQPDPMAGLMSGGDDNNQGLAPEGMVNGDDEDGVMLLSPLVPNTTATLMVTAMNMTGSPAVLQAWIDFNGNDVFDATEQLTTGSFAPSGAVVPVSGLNGSKLTFTVPAVTTFFGGEVFMRFRVSPSGGLTANGPEQMPYPTGEVEDYKVPVAKVGNLVWNDYNNDGIQNEPTSAGLNNIGVNLIWFGTDGVPGGLGTDADVTYSTTTSNMGVDGQYMFTGLISGAYKLLVPTVPTGFIPTQLNIGSDISDSDDRSGEMVMIIDPADLLTGENSTGDVANDPVYPDNHNNLSYDFGFITRDFGDMPDTYATTLGATGAVHVVDPRLKLGAVEDGEPNGQPDAMAGLMSGGDDNNNGVLANGTPSVSDDEDGIVFETPLIAGYTSCVRVSAMNMTGSAAVLQMWVDFNGDGDVQDAGEEVNTQAFAPGGAIIPAGGVNNAQYCFDVPSTATFFGGQAMVRFRLSPNGGLASGGPSAAPLPRGEVEDYKVTLAKVGNYVWIDLNVNGQQDEPGILGLNNIQVELTWSGPDGSILTTGDNLTYLMNTAPDGGVNGKYKFCGLIPGTYRLRVPSFGYTPTILNVGNDITDSDNPAGVTFVVPTPPTSLITGEFGTGDNPLVVNGFPDNQADFTYDFGYLGFDLGDLPNSYSTRLNNSGAVHTVTPNLYLGASVDIEADGQPDVMAGFMGGGDDGGQSPGVLGTSVPAGDDENGIGFATPLIPGSSACLRVSARNATGANALLQAWIDYNGDGTLQAGEQLSGGNFAAGGAVIPAGGVTNALYCFDVPVTATFAGGNLFARFRLSASGGQGSTGPVFPAASYPVGEVEDYKLPLARIGNYVWMDNPDIEGDQDADEMSLAGVKLNLIWNGEDGVFQTAANSATPAGDDRVYMTTTDGSGRYGYLGLLPGSSYRLLAQKYTAVNGVAGSVIAPVGKILTIPNLPSNDNIDSDGSPLINIAIPNLTTVFLPTQENGLQDANGQSGFPDNQENLSYDLGFITEPRINAALAITGFDPTVCGEFAVWMDLCIENTSTAPLANLTAMLDLAGPTAYGAAFRGMIGAPVIVSSTAQQNPVLNSGYTGAATAPGKNLFDGQSGLLWPGEKVCIRLKFGVDPDIAGAPANPRSQAMVSGKAQNFNGVPIPDYWNGGQQYMAMDASDAGTDPRGTNPGVIGDTGGSDDPTPLGPCWYTTQQMVCNDLVHISIADDDCEALINATGVMEGEQDECTEEVYPLGGFYDVTITNLQGQPIANPVPLTYIGQKLIYKATHIMTCEPCWGYFILEDKQTPKVSCEDIELNCMVKEYSPAYLSGTLGFPTAYPDVYDCTTTSATYVDTWTDLGCGEGFNGRADLSAYVTRVWTVKDAHNNASSCTQYIYFDRLHVQDVSLPGSATVSCGAGNTSPQATGTPYVQALGRTWNLWPDVQYCELTVTYEDLVISICGGTYEIERTWRINDWCLPTSQTSNPLYWKQIIYVKDESGPQIACPADVTVSVDAFACCATTDLPDAVIEDACSNINGIQAKVVLFERYTGDSLGIQVVGGTVADFAGNNYWDLDTLGAYGMTQCLPVGVHHVYYAATDACGNSSSCSFRMTVADLVPPVAACDQLTQVALGGSGEAFVDAATFNDGSFDMCDKQLQFKVRRMDANTCQTDTLYHDEVKFCCSDINDTITVILRVYDVDVPAGIVQIEDYEGHYNDCMVQVLVEDKTKPFCAPPANVTVTCEQFDPSLWLYDKAVPSDNCCLDDTKVYQGQAGLTHTVSYTNFDTLCNKGTIVRTFRAFDCGGNSSQCTQRIVVTYEQDYFVRFPDDRIITVCDGTGDYGEPTFYGEDCELLGVTYEDEIFTVVPDACFKIERNWKIINWCTFNPNAAGINVPNPNPNAITNHPTNLPGPIVSPIQTAGDPWKSTIVKINPTDAQATNYSVFYNANANFYTYKQIIKIVDTQDPVADCSAAAAAADTICDITSNDAALWNEMYWWDLTNSTHDLGDAPSDISLTATDACSGANISFEYQLLLDLDGDGTMETVVNSTQLGSQPGGLGWNNVLYNNVSGNATSRQFDNRPVAPNQKWGFAIQEVVSGNKKTASVKFNTQQAQNTFVTPQLPYGKHKIKWFVTDGCGNETICEYPIEIRDCKAPTVVCYNGLSVNIMPTGMITMNDVDFLEYTVDNYTQNQFLRTGIRKCGAGSGFPFDANGNPITTVTFNCNELGTQCVELWSIDLAGNADYCETYIIVQDNNGNCPNSDKVNVSGSLKTESTDGVEEAAVTIDGTVNFAPPFSYFDLSDNLGEYKVLNSVPVASNYTITPAKDDNPLNGVTTYDLVLISKHILGIEPLGSPYKMIAADANKSNSITTFDIVELRKLILGIYTELPNNTSWRFVDKSQQFANPLNPFTAPLKENISIADAQSNLVEDFVGVKIGDVNGTAVANSAMQVDDRTNGTLLFDVNDRVVKAGETFDVTFRASEMTQGYQMTLNLNGLEVAGIVKSDKVSESNFGVFGDALTVSVDGEQAFTVTFRAKKSGKLSEMIGVSGRITKAEGYSMANNRLDVALRFGGNTISGVGFELYQNQPNPFVNRTVIGFHLPEAATAVLTITDESGRLIYTQKGDYAKGYNAIAVDRALLNTTGILYYTVKAGDDAATLKMIQVD